MGGPEVVAGAGLAGLLSQAGQALNVWMADAQAFLQQFGNLLPATSDPGVSPGQVQGSPSSNAGNTAPGNPDPNDPWDRFSRLIGQGKTEFDAAVEASTQGSGDRFVIGPYEAPPGTLNYINEASQRGGRYFDAGARLWGELEQKGITEQVNRQVIYNQMQAGISRIEISSGYTIQQVLDSFPSSKWLVKEIGWIQALAAKFGYIENAAGTGWIKP